MTAVPVLVAVLVSIPTADAGNCYVAGYNRGYVVQQSYVAPVQAVQTYGYSTIYPQAYPVALIPDTFYRVDSALAYARIAEAAAEAAVTKQNTQIVALFQDFLKQQAQLQKLPAAEKLDVPPPLAQAKDGSPAGDRAKKFIVANCTRCHNPNTPKRLNLEEAAIGKLTAKQGTEIYFRLTAPDESKKVMPPKEKGKNRPTTIEDVNAIHEWVSGLPE